jgi:nicotinamide mononucleotide (NMN) deamidase PncC
VACSADVFLGGIVAPCPRTLGSVIGVATESVDIDGEGIGGLARQMAAAVRDRFGADLGVSLLGAPAPEARPLEGSLTIAIATGTDRALRQYTFPVEGDRFRVLAAYVALGQVRRAIRVANRG